MWVAVLVFLDFEGLVLNLEFQRQTLIHTQIVLEFRDDVLQSILLKGQFCRLLLFCQIFCLDVLTTKPEHFIM